MELRRNRMLRCGIKGDFFWGKIYFDRRKPEYIKGESISW